MKYDRMDVTDYVDENGCLSASMGEPLWMSYGPFVIEHQDDGRYILRFTHEQFYPDEP